MPIDQFEILMYAIHSLIWILKGFGFLYAASLCIKLITLWSKS